MKLKPSRSLRTLKDICEDEWCGTKNGIPDCKRCKRLRAEAIKWVKELPGCEVFENDYWICKWIKHFFNITEEDLE